MNAAAVLFSSALLSGLLTAQREIPTPDLRIQIEPERVDFHLAGPGQDFVGAILLSLDSTQTHYLQGLPPILSNFAVLAIGAAKGYGEIVITVPDSRFQPGIMFYAQGLTLDGFNIMATPVRDLVLDAGPPSGGSN